MNILLRIEKWLYIHFNILLPSWRGYWEAYSESIQEEIDKEFLARTFIDSLED